MILIAIVMGTLAAGIGSVWLAALLGFGVLSRYTQHMLSLAAGALLGTAFLHLLPEAFESAISAKALFATLLVGLRIQSRSFLFGAFAVQLLGGGLFLLQLQASEGSAGGVFSAGWRGLMPVATTTMAEASARAAAGTSSTPSSTSSPGAAARRRHAASSSRPVRAWARRARRTGWWR